MTRKIFDLSRKFKQEGGFEEYKSKDETPEELAKYLLSLIPFEPDDFVIDAGSGKTRYGIRIYRRAEKMNMR